MQINWGGRDDLLPPPGKGSGGAEAQKCEGAAGRPVPDKVWMEKSWKDFRSFL